MGDVFVDERKVVQRLPDSVASFFNLFIIRKTTTNCHRSVVKPSKTRRGMDVIWRWSGRDRCSIITKFWLKTNFIYYLLPVAQVLSSHSKTKKRFFTSVVCFECVTPAAIKVHWQSADATQPTRFDHWNLFCVAVIVSSKYHHLSIDCGRARPIRASFFFE